MSLENSLANQITRDLKWIFCSPPLVDKALLSFQNNPLDSAWVEEISQSGGLLESFMTNKNLKMLGTYFEALWEFYLSYYPGNKLVAKNLQVFDGNKTIGEFDFIYLNELTNEYHHLEVAIKYFLGINDQNNNIEARSTERTNIEQENTEEINTEQKNNHSLMKSWIGPNTNDRLDKKYLKMKRHQSQLSRHTAGKKALEKIGINNVKSEVCLLGSLFYPYVGNELEAGAMQPPEHSYLKHNKECWIQLRRVNQCLITSAYWAVLDKPHWMASIVKQVSELDDRRSILNKIKKHFLQSSRPLLITSFKVDNQCDDHLLYSTDKYFIVPDCWPLKKS